MHPHETGAAGAVQTTGHAWDGDLQEFNNPLPRWWLWSFYATVVFAVIYWFIYPTWPIGEGWTRGLATVDVVVNGEPKKLGWNTRSELLEDMQKGSAAVKQREYLEKIDAASFEAINSNPEMLAFARAAGSKLFGDNCAACHGRGGQGVMGLFPNLADDDWLWGGSFAKIQETLTKGRDGFMPAFHGILSDAQLDDVSHYVLSLSGEVAASESSARGEAVFKGYAGGCYQCHGETGKGLQSQGAANLTDKIWTIVNVPAKTGEAEKISAIKQFVAQGVQQGRKMPAWAGRLSSTDIKLLTVYVHQIGGGQ